MYFLGNVLGICVPYDFKKKAILNQFFKVYAAFMFAILIGIYLYSIHGTIRNTYPYMTAMEIFTETCVFLCIILLDSSSILETYTKKRLWIKMMGTFKSIDIYLVKSLNKKNPVCYSIWIQLFFAHLIYFIVECGNMIIWTKEYGFGYYRYYIFEVVVKYYTMIIVMFICNFALSIKYRYERFNEELRKADILNVSELRILFKKLSYLVQIFNNIFGLQMLLVLSVSIMSLLDVLSFIMVYHKHASMLLDLFYFLDTIILMVRIKA